MFSICDNNPSPQSYYLQRANWSGKAWTIKLKSKLLSFLPDGTQHTAIYEEIPVIFTCRVRPCSICSWIFVNKIFSSRYVTRFCKMIILVSEHISNNCCLFQCKWNIWHIGNYHYHFYPVPILDIVFKNACKSFQLWFKEPNFHKLRI